VPGTDQHIEQRPYRGMQQFSEQHKDLFFGRSKPIDEIFDLLKNNLLAVIFGKSGIGKSSLINAGLLPKLRENFYLPVLIRIPFSDARVDPLAYTRACIEAEVKRYIFKGFVYPEDTTLWQFFREANYSGGAVVPVLIFDQFEEYFSFGKQNKQRTEKFIQELSDLIENRMPAHLENIDKYKTLNTTDTQNIFRVVISLREDYLAPLEDLGRLIPSLNKVRYRILQLHGEEAFNAVYLPAKNLIDETTAIHLLKKIIPKKIDAKASSEIVNAPRDDDWKDKDFEPYILSLFCYQVNEKRIAANQNKISETLINQTKVETILSDYYDSSLKKYWRRYHKQFGHVLEKNLISDEGYRLLKPVNAKEFKNIPEQAINDMVDDRIIHRETRNDISYVEISHDLLAKVIYERKAAGRTNKRIVMIAAIFVIVLGGLFLLGLLQQKQKLQQANNTLKTYDSTIKKQDSIKVKDSAKINSLNSHLVQIITGDTLNSKKAGTVYFQANLIPPQSNIQVCMRALKKLNFNVPAAQKVKDMPAKNLIRYYYADDEANADLIKSICDKYYTMPFEIQFFRSLGQAKGVKPGTLEVWIYYASDSQDDYYSDPGSVSQ